MSFFSTSNICSWLQIAHPPKFSLRVGETLTCADCITEPLHRWINDSLSASLTAQYHSVYINKQCWQSQRQKDASHDMNMEDFMHDYIFYNILAVGNSRLTCIRLDCNMRREMWHSEETRQSFYSNTAQRCCNNVNLDGEPGWGYGWMLTSFYCCTEFH